jgi:hypothetical protein
VFLVEGMSSSRLAGAVARAVRALDRGADVRTDPATQRLDVEPGLSDAQDIIDMLRVAGFTATLEPSESESAFDWVDSRSSTGVEDDGAVPASAVVEFSVTPIGNCADDRFADSSGSISMTPALRLGPLGS